MTDRCEVAIVGAGPVGLLLGARLTQQGIDARVIEKDSGPSLMSRAIGIHPPALRCLDDLGVADDLIALGIPVRKGLAFAGGCALGAVSFSALPKPFNFVLTVPQHHTEAVLSRRLEQYSSGALRRGHRVLGISANERNVVLRFESDAGEGTLEADFVVGCDGKHSVIRTAIGADFRGGPYPERFLMGDVPDDTPYGPYAAVFLTSSGLCESFPLPLQRRRWVASTGTIKRAPSAHLLGRIVKERTGHTLRTEEATLVSAFTAEHYLASTLAQGRVTLAGDSAHVVSPIGGQGMNLGWLDAWALSDVLYDVLCRGKRHEPLFADYERERMRAARAAMRRAEMFMRIGRGIPFRTLKDAFVRSLLSPWFAKSAARLFTMNPL